MTSYFARAVRSLAAAGAVAAGLSAQEVANKEPVALPEYNVTAERELPPPESWFYARIEGFEVLSSAGEGETRELLKNFQRFALGLDLLWPGMRPSNAVPAALIICGRDRRYESFLPATQQAGEQRSTAFSLRTVQGSALVLDEETRILNLATSDLANQEAAPTLPSEGGADATGTDATVDLGFSVDPNQQLYREYVRFLTTGMNPPISAWFAEGLAQLFMNMRITETEISVGRVQNPNLATENRGAVVREDGDFNEALGGRALIPWPEFFAVILDAETARASVNNAWGKQAYAFVHWGLYGDFGRNQKAFVKFLLRSAQQPVTEELFKECFKLTYAEGLQALRNHIEMTRSRVVGVRAEKGQKLPQPPAVELREATQAEIARLKADVLVLAGHAEAARAELITAYRRGERPPLLLAALGEAELAAGEPARARKFLELAAAAKVVRPSAYVALARLRLAEAKAQPLGGNGKLSAEQLKAVLGPLFVARSQPPRRPDTYAVIAEAWAASATPPAAAHLAVVEEGRRFFPADPALRAAAEALPVPQP